MCCAGGQTTGNDIWSLQRIGKFLKKNDLITIPPLAEETWGMYMMFPERQLVSPFFLGGESIIISYPTNQWMKMRS